jgi:hypothetical protein
MSYIFTQEELEKLCKEWQEILKVKDWHVETAINRKENFCKEKFQGKWLNGLCEPNLQTKVAYINIIDPIDYPDNAILSQDMEVTLVHELLHLHTCNYHTCFEDDSLEWDYLEQTVELLARALVNLKRQNVKEAN